jgi:hypothetical protein
MQIVDVNIGDHYMLVNKKGFCFAMKGVQTHYVVPMRLLINLAFSEGGNFGMESFIVDSQRIMFREIPAENFLNKTIREVCREFEIRDIIEFYKDLSKEEKDEFRAVFESPGMFGESPLYAFRNSGGVDFV